MTSNPDPDIDLDEQTVEIIRRGAISPVPIHPLSLVNANTLRMRIYRLRKKLIKLNHADARSAKLIVCKLSRLDASSWCLTVQPRSFGFEQAFANAGLTTPSDDPPDLE